MRAGSFEKGNQAGDGVCLPGNNYFERTVCHAGIRGWSRCTDWKAGLDSRRLREKVSRKGSVKMLSKHVNVGELIHELREADFDGKLPANGVRNLRQG